MVQTRVISTTYGKGGEDRNKPNNGIVEEITEEISDEQLADEASAEALARVDDIIDGIRDLDQARTFLKRLCRRLVKNGVLP